LIEDLAAPLLGWVEANGRWAPLVLLLVAFLESLPVIGLFVPGSLVLVGTGLLVAAGVLSPLPVLAATVLGAAAVRRHLPRRYRRTYARSLLGFRRFGWWAVFVGRFLAPLRAFVPIAAGVSRMPERSFQTANVASALVWAPLLLLPGWLAGSATALPAGSGGPHAGLALLAIAVTAGVVAFRRRRAEPAPSGHLVRTAPSARPGPGRPARG
jgi:membrane protein DedA with SNARE-associated domain